MLELASAFITLANLGLSLVVGVRILRGADPGAPERWLGAHFIFYQFAASVLSISLYTGWSDPELAPPPAVLQALNAGFHCFSLLGMAGLLLFARRAFRPDAAWAAAWMWVLIVAMALGAVGLGVTERFEVRVVNGPAYWVVWAARLCCFVWVAVESWAYWSRMRRRSRIGLADPLVTNRFLLWGAWATSVSIMAFSDPMARLWYCLRADTVTSWVPEIGQPIIAVVVAFTSVFGICAALTLFLAFFPTPAYRRWVEGRAESGAHS